jgi:hypothetical protein
MAVLQTLRYVGGHDAVDLGMGIGIVRHGETFTVGASVAGKCPGDWEPREGEVPADHLISDDGAFHRDPGSGLLAQESNFELAEGS